MNKRPYVSRWTFYGAARAANKYLRARELNTEFSLSSRHLGCLRKMRNVLLALIKESKHNERRTKVTRPGYFNYRQMLVVLQAILRRRLDRPPDAAEITHALERALATGDKLLLAAKRRSSVYILSDAVGMYHAMMHGYYTRPKQLSGRRELSRREPKRTSGHFIMMREEQPLPDRSLNSILLLGDIGDAHAARPYEINERFHLQVETLIERGYHRLIGQSVSEFRRTLEPLRSTILARGAHVNGRIPFLIAPHGQPSLRELMNLVEVSPHGRYSEVRSQGRLMLDETRMEDIPSTNAPGTPYLLLDVAHGGGVRKTSHSTYIRLMRAYGRSPLTARELMLYIIQHETKLDYYKLLAAGTRYAAIYTPYILYNGSSRLTKLPRAEMHFITEWAAEHWRPAPPRWRPHVRDRLTSVNSLWRAIPTCAARIAT